jgi:hypothetical protein
LTKDTARSRTTATKTRLIEEDIEIWFFGEAKALVLPKHYEAVSPASAGMVFTARYTELLRDAFVKYVECTKASDVAEGRISWQEAEKAAFDFVERFYTGKYKNAYAGTFLRKHPQWMNPHLAITELKRLHENAPWTSFEDRESLFNSETASGMWRGNAVTEARRRISLVEVPPGKPLKKREDKIWEVIRRGATGLQYCRELDNAGVAPLRSGIWKDCPRKYASAYLDREWQHRIQDEKSKITRKAELATRRKLASE